MMNLESYGEVTISMTRRELGGRHRHESKASVTEGALNTGRKERTQQVYHPGDPKNRQGDCT